MALGTRARRLPSRPVAPSLDSAPVDAPVPARHECHHGAALDGLRDGYTVLRAVRQGDTVTDWVVVDANTLVRDRWKAVVSDVIGVRASALDVAYDNSLFHDLYRTALASGERQEMDLELTLPAGKGGWRRTIVVPVDPETVAVFTRDITRERYFETSLDRSRRAFHALAAKPVVGKVDVGRTSDAHLLGRSAAYLFVGAGAVAIANSLLTVLPRVDVRALLLTGLLSIVVGLVVPLLPWSRHRNALIGGLVVGAIGFIVISDQFNHFSHSRSAVAVYPIFFVMIVAWSGLSQVRGAASVTACLSALALGSLLASGGFESVGWQCVIVTMPAAAVLGEVLSWSHNRASMLAGLEVTRRLHDPLTELASRQFFVERVDQALARARRNERAVAVLFIDLDRFKQVNDSLGHAAGDELLIHAAGRLRAAVRESDDVARFGGDEFAVLCEDLDDRDGAIEIARRVLRAFDSPFLCATRDVVVSASVGIASSIGGGETAESLLRDADAAMYRAKGDGRARFEVFDKAMQHHLAARLELETSLRRAVPDEALRVVYQPIIGGESRSVVGFEALVRWERPGFGLVGPAGFIAVAEETGLILDIGEWVLREACCQAVVWSTTWPDRRVRISVNVSSKQVLEGDIVTVVRGALTASGLDPTLLVLELTESSLIDNAVEVQDILGQLRRLGVSIALDDFGTGYSSLTYLRSFPIDVIKIDGSFVRTLAAEREASAIVAAVISLARSLDLEVVAEGVECSDQLAVLADLGCDHFQGYLFARPTAAEDVVALMEGSPPWTAAEPVPLRERP
ncbi:MAG TPA: EAL domain-containing protein [Acidimicrobiales bacterium]|nr:EAL domain-containing protein [Acidimicrobiales bacterium]